MRYLLLFILLSAPYFLWAQKALHGKIIDDKHRPVMYCLVQVNNSNEVIYSNEEGEFTVNDADSIKTLKFYCLGYDKKEMAISGNIKDPINVSLIKRDNDLKEIHITASKGRLKEGVLGKRNLTPFGIAESKYGHEDAIYLKCDSSRNGYLKSVYFYISDEGIPTTKFRVHVYNIDSSRYGPGDDITDSNVIIHANKGNEWVSADLSAKRIKIGRGIFVSMEWIPGEGNSQRSMDARNYGARGFNGQVLSQTRGYYKEGFLAYYRNVLDKTWNYSSYAVYKQKHIINPMIYCTYNYVK